MCVHKGDDGSSYVIFIIFYNHSGYDLTEIIGVLEQFVIC